MGKMCTFRQRIQYLEYACRMFCSDHFIKPKVLPALINANEIKFHCTAIMKITFPIWVPIVRYFKRIQMSSCAVTICMTLAHFTSKLPSALVAQRIFWNIHIYIHIGKDWKRSKHSMERQLFADTLLYQCECLRHSYPSSQTLSFAASAL